MLINKIFNWYFKKSVLPYWCILFLDSMAVMASGYFCIYLKFGGEGFVHHFWPLTHGLMLSLLIFIVNFKLFHTYTGIIRFSSFVDLQRLAVSNGISTLIVIAASKLLSILDVYGIMMLDVEFILAFYIGATMIMWVARIFVKRVFDQLRMSSDSVNAFIYGAAAGAVAVAKSIQNTEPELYKIRGFISPDGKLVGTYLMGAKVYEDSPAVIEFMKENKVSAIIVSPIQIDHFRNQENLINDLIQAGIRILIMPSPETWDGVSPINGRNFKEVDIEDLLPRAQIEIDMESISVQLQGKSILITGAAGSIGSEIVRQAASFKPRLLVLVDQAETPMHDIRLMMRNDFPDVETKTIVASITNERFMEQIFEKYRPEYIFHAAAYKHVPMMEDNPAIAVQNNIRGTRVIADLAVKYGTGKFVMISTDKAVNPTNVMGCSKRICEIYCQSLNKAIQEGKMEGVTQFVTTRFGNVLGSNGSVIPIFREQIKKGGPLTVTDPNIIRFFMLIPEACKLVLEAGTIGKGGEIFVFDMGKPVRIADLAKRMIALSGAKDIEIKYTGLRDGEKLYEEILSDQEKTKPTPNKKIFVAEVREYDYEFARQQENNLLKLSLEGTSLEIVRAMQDIVPEYKTTNQAYL